MADLLIERDEVSFKEQGVAKLLTKYSNYGLLVLDEWLLDDLLDEDFKFIFELMNDATVLTPLSIVHNFGKRIGTKDWVVAFMPMRLWTELSIKPFGMTLER